jgi:Kdo2-lipid IVA lauroyltransferase/acyltransferase
MVETPSMNYPMKKIRYVLEAIGVRIFFVLLRTMSLDTASSIGGWLGRHLGPLHKSDRIARANLAKIMPELSREQIEQIIRDMWDNLGRTMGEYPHLTNATMAERMQVIGHEHFETARNSGTSSLFIGGHFANWELAPKSAGLYGYPLVLIYRQANNAMVDGIIRNTRLSFAQSMFPKGRKGAIELIKAIREARPIGMLVDQKMNEGVAIPFMGQDAMTATATAELALKYDLPIYMAQVIRLKGAHFRVIIHPPLQITSTHDKQQDVLNTMTTINQIFEQWVREHPAQWFWVHRRWPKETIRI